MRLVVLALLVAAGGCSAKNPPEVQACEALLLPTLKSPSSYKLVDSFIALPDKDGRRNVYLTYDAVNSYNAPLRDKFYCDFDPKTGVAVNMLDQILPDNLDVEADNFTVTPPVVEKPPKPEPEEEVPVCDRPDSAEKSALMEEIGTDCTGE